MIRTPVSSDPDDPFDPDLSPACDACLTCINPLPSGQWKSLRCCPVRVLIGSIALATLNGTESASTETASLMQSGPAPAWVSAIAFDPHVEQASDPDDPGDGIAYLVWDSVVDLASETRYFRTAYKVVSSSGLEDAANVSALFDPTYQSLIWHAITVTRSGAEVYRINLEDIEVSRRYEDLEWSTYDSSYTAFLLLKDLRVGDTVDFSYSLIGFNPVFDHMLSERTYLQWSVPVRFVRMSYHVPLGRTFITWRIPPHRPLRPHIQLRP